MSESERSLIAEFSFSHSFLRATLAELPETTLSVEQLAAVDEETAYLDVWATGGAFERFEAALDARDSVGATALSGVIDGRKLYRIRFRPSDATYFRWIRLGGVLVRATGTYEGWQIRMQFPHREAFAEYLEFCRAEGYAVTTEKLFEAGSPDAEFDLTERQRRILVAALERGYFDIPRRTTLDGLAAQFDISSQAVSERLRRGTATVLSDVL